MFITDCTGISSTERKSLASIMNHRLQWLFIELSQLNFSIQHLHGDKMKVCDALSQAPQKTFDFIDEEERLKEENNTKT